MVLVEIIKYDPTAKTFTFLALGVASLMETNIRCPYRTDMIEKRTYHLLIMELKIDLLWRHNAVGVALKLSYEWRN